MVLFLLFAHDFVGITKSLRRIEKKNAKKKKNQQEPVMGTEKKKKSFKHFVNIYIRNNVHGIFV